MREQPAVTVGVRYCGGCNPRYDRAAFVRSLAAACPDVRLEGALPGGRYDRLVVVCGCLSQCADYAGIESTGGTLVVAPCADFDRACAFILNGINSICLLP